MRLSVVGAGRRALVQAAVAAEWGHEVLVTVPESVRAALADGRMPFHEPGLATLFAQHAASGRLSLASEPAELTTCATHILSLDVPATADGADLAPVRAAIAGLIPQLSPGCFVVGSFPAPVGTAQWLSQWLSGTVPGAKVAWVPVLASSGGLVTGQLNPPLIAYGLPGEVPSEDAVARLDDVFAPLVRRRHTPRFVLPFAAAELLPLVHAARCALDQTFAHYLAELADAAGVALGAWALPGLSTPAPAAGLGFGGEVAQAVALLAASTERLGLEHRGALVRDTLALNADRPWTVANLAMAALGGEAGPRRIAILGAGSRPDTDDLTDSPALALAAIVTKSGHHVTVSDPVASEEAIRGLGHAFVRDPYHACGQGDLVIVACAWHEYRALDPVRLGARVRRTSLLDTTGTLDPAQWRAAGWTYRDLGR